MILGKISFMKKYYICFKFKTRMSFAEKMSRGCFSKMFFFSIICLNGYALQNILYSTIYCYINYPHQAILKKKIVIFKNAYLTVFCVTECNG